MIFILVVKNDRITPFLQFYLLSFFFENGRKEAKENVFSLSCWINDTERRTKVSHEISIFFLIILLWKNKNGEEKKFGMHISFPGDQDEKLKLLGNRQSKVVSISSCVKSNMRTILLPHEMAADLLSATKCSRDKR